jgi:hypothetical protein
MRATVTLALLLAAVAAWIGLATLHDAQHADSLLPVLVSLQRWTLFYWGQDRFGMLVPLLTLPIRHPLINMLAQGWLTTWSAFAAPFLAARFLNEDPPIWVTAGSVTNILLLGVVSREVRFDWFVAQPYGVAMALGFTGLLVAETDTRSARVAALTLLLLAEWVNLTTVLVLAPALVARGRVRSIAMAFTVASLAANALLARLVSTPHTITTLDVASDWPHGWTTLAWTSVTVIVRPLIAAAFVAVGAAAALISVIRGRRDVLVAVAAALAIGVTNWLVVGTSAWVHMNLYAPRYMFPSLMMFGLAMTRPLAGALDHAARIALIGSLTAFAVVAGVVYGSPSWHRLNRQIDHRFAGMSRDVITSSASVIAGQYWSVWPAVFHANLTRYRETGKGSVYGLTVRSETTDALWNKPGARVIMAATPGDRAIGIYADRAGLLLEHIESRPAIELFLATASR